MTPDELSSRLLVFAAGAGRLVDSLPDTRLGRHIAGQLVRSATSPAPNYEEARAAESRSDFIHKLSICLKELRETRTWLRLIVEARLFDLSEVRRLSDESDELTNIIAQSINTARKNAQSRRSGESMSNG